MTDRIVLSPLEPSNTIGETVNNRYPERSVMASNSTGDRTLDVREIDGEPFTDIMSALEELEGAETLLLINSFEPKPLYGVLEQRGFDYETAEVSDDEWHVAIERT